MFAVVLACLVAVAYAQKNCCSPTQWEGKLGIVIASNAGNGSLTEGGIEMAYDAVTRMVAQNQDLYVNGMETKQRLVIDYNKGIMNIIRPDGSCNRVPSDQWVSNCIPDNATVSDIVFGVGATAVKAKNYVIPFPTGTVYMTATADTCVPLTENVVGSFGKANIFEEIVFVNITAGISNKAMFNVPAACSAVAVGPPVCSPLDPASPFIPELGRRSLFR